MDFRGSPFSDDSIFKFWSWPLGWKPFCENLFAKMTQNPKKINPVLVRDDGFFKFDAHVCRPCLVPCYPSFWWSWAKPARRNLTLVQQCFKFQGKASAVFSPSLRKRHSFFRVLFSKATLVPPRHQRRAWKPEEPGGSHEVNLSWSQKVANPKPWTIMNHHEPYHDSPFGSGFFWIFEYLQNVSFLLSTIHIWIVTDSSMLRRMVIND